MMDPALKDVLDAMPFAVFVKDSAHRWVYGNSAFEALIGRDDFIGMDDRDLFSQDQVDVFWREDDRVLAGEESLNEEEIGDNRFALTRKVPLTLPDGSAGLLGVIIDYINLTPKAAQDGSVRPSDIIDPPEMTALQKRLEEALNDKAKALEVARTDAATGLRNRYGLEVDLERQIRRAGQTGQSFGFALVDLDHFKRINDRFGHSVGDEVLRTIGRRLAALPGVISAGRIGGDEFAIITEEVATFDETLIERVERFRQMVFRPTALGERELRLSGSAGLCLFPRDAQTASELLSRADLALLAAKKNGRATSKIFDEATLGAYQRRLHIEEKLPAALESERVFPVFQPIVSSHTRRAVGVEVLARWTDTCLGPVSPEEFVAAATDTGLIGKLDRLVFRKAMAEAKAWVEQGYIEFVSLNVSPMDVVSPGYATELLREIEIADIAPRAVCLEILESSLVEDVSSARRNLNRLREAGVQIALDDYGTGFSNLRALLDMPLDKLKIDKSLVSGIEGTDKVLDLVISLVQLGRALDLTMVAEGVETETQSAFIEGAGCPEMQGYFFSRPLDAAAMTQWLAGQASDEPIVLDIDQRDRLSS